MDARDPGAGPAPWCDGQSCTELKEWNTHGVTERWSIGLPGTTCGLCGDQGLVLSELRLVRRRLARLRPGFDVDRRVYELCEGCDAKHTVELVA